MSQSIDTWDHADLVGGVHDARFEGTPNDWQPPAGKSVHLEVWNKMDLIPEDTDGASTRRTTTSDTTVRVRVSARTGDGLDELITQIQNHLMPRSPAPGAPLAWRLEQFRSLEALQAALQASDSNSALRLLHLLLASES